MSDGKSRFRKHVRAAREWLGRAENSLDQQDDIRGDLNLMLAQAELQRAQETKRLTRKEIWFRRSVPFLAAGIMVAGCFVFLQSERPLGKAVQPQAAIVSVPVQEAETVVTVKRELPHYSREPAAETAVVAADRGNSSPSLVPQTPVQSSETGQVLEAAPQEVAVPQERPKTGVPPENMQKLMQSAGQTLRAH